MLQKRREILAFEHYLLFSSNQWVIIVSGGGGGGGGGIPYERGSDARRKLFVFRQILLFLNSEILIHYLGFCSL